MPNHHSKTENTQLLSKSPESSKSTSSEKKNSTSKKISKKKILRILITWLFIPLIIDVINILLLNDILPYFWLAREISWAAVIATFVIWTIYGTIAWYITKKIRNKKEKSELSHK